MIKKSSLIYRISAALLLVIMMFNISAFSIYSTAEVFSELASSSSDGGAGGDQVIGGDDPTLGEITIPTVSKNPYKPTVHQLLYPVMPSDRIYTYDSMLTSIETNGQSSEHSGGYTLSLSALLGYYTQRRYSRSVAEQKTKVYGQRADTLNPDLYVSGQELRFGVNTGGEAGYDYTNFIGGSYVNDQLHLNKDHLDFVLYVKQVGTSHVKMNVSARLSNGKTVYDDYETTSNGDTALLKVPLKDAVSLSGSIDAYSYNSAFTDVVAMLVDNTSPSVTAIDISQEIHENDNADLVMTMTFNEGIRFADLREERTHFYLDDMWVEVEVEELETGEKSRVKLYTSEVGTDCTMTLRADIGRYHYKNYRVNRVTRVGFYKTCNVDSAALAAIDVTAKADGLAEDAIYPLKEATGIKYGRADRVTLITPITDIAGNSVHLDSIVNWEFGEQFNTPSYGIEEIEIYNDKTLGVADGTIDEDDLLSEDLFIGTASNMTVKVYISRILTEDQWKSVALKLNILDADGNQIILTPTRAMEYSRNNLYDNGKIKGSVLIFENVRLPSGAKPDIESGTDPLIRVTEWINGIDELSFYPYFDHPSTDMRVDVSAPTVTARLVSDQVEETDGGKYYTALIELVLSDVEDYGRIAGLAGGEIDLSIGTDTEDEVGFKYSFGTDPIPPATPDAYTGEASFTKNGYAKVGHLNIINNTEKIYLHVLVDQSGIYIDDFKLNVQLTDAIGNLNDQSELPIRLDYLIDEVPPEIKILEKKSYAVEENTKIKLDVSVGAVDPSTVRTVEYYVGDYPDSEDAVWTEVIKDNEGSDTTATVSLEYGGLGSDTNKVINEILWVRASDYRGNVSEPVSTYINLSLEKPSTNAALLTDGGAVSTSHVLIVEGPDASSLNGETAYTRVTISPMSGGFTYVAIVKTGERVNLLDLKYTDDSYDVAYFYKVEMMGQSGSAVYSSVEGPVRYVNGEAVKGHLLEELLTYYGELKISFENGYGDMTPAIGDTAYDAASEGSYYKDPNYITLRFASPCDEGRSVHSVDFGRVVSRSDELIADHLASGSAPALIRQSEIGFGAMRNMQIHFSIENIADRTFGYLDLDYESSFVEFYLLSEDGGEDVLMQRVTGLSASGNQYFTVSNTDDSGNLYGTGAYYLRVTVVSRSMHTDVYESGLIVLDAETADKAGVWEYSYFSPSNIKSVNDPTSYSPVTVTRDPESEDYFTDFGISVMAGGESMRSRVFAVYTYGVDSLTVVLSAPDSARTVAGVEVGKVTGFKLWNILTAPSADEIERAPFMLDREGDSLTIYDRLDDIYDKDTIPKGLEGIGALNLVKGVNTFCYQTRLENGYVSPIRYFTVTVTDTAPTLNVAIDDYIPSHKASDVSGVVNIDSVRMFIETAYSFNGSGRVDVRLWGTYAMKLGLYSESGEIEEHFLDTDEDGEDINGGLRVIRSGLTEGEYAVLTENSYTSDFPEYMQLCTAAFVAVDEYGGTTIIAPQLGNAQRHNVYGGVANEKEYNINYYGDYYNDPYVLGDNLISWRVIYNEPSYNGNILLGFESYLVHNTENGEQRIKTVSTDDASLGRNLFNISSNDILPYMTMIDFDYGPDKRGAMITYSKIDNAELITSRSTITISGDGIDGEVVLPLFEPNTEYGYLGASISFFGYERTKGIEFGFANPMADGENPVGTQRALKYKLTFDNGYDETFSTPEYLEYEGSDGMVKNPYYAGDVTLYYIDYSKTAVEMTESGEGAVVIPSFATPDGFDTRILVGRFDPNTEEGSDGKYTVSVTDLFGRVHELEYLIDTSIVTDRESKVSIDNTAKTSKPVTVTIERASGKVFVDITDYDIMSVEGNETSRAVVTLKANTTFSYRYISSEGYEKCFFIKVANIVTPDVSVTLDRDVEGYATDPVTKENFFYGEITAYVTDPNFVIIDASSGLPASFTFIPGGETSYTYPEGTLLARLGNGDAAEYITLGEITVSIPYELREIPDLIEKAEADDVAPALQVLAYSNQAGIWSDEGLALRLTSRRGFFALTDYADYKTFAFSGERANMEKLLSEMGWSTSYRFVFEIQDESRVRLFVKEGIYAEAPAFENGISDPIDGVTLNSKLLTVTKAAEFTVFAVDSEGNYSSVAFNVNNVGEAPAPTVKRVPIKDGVRVYLVAPEGAEELEILSVGLTVGIESTEGEFYGLPYVDVKKNDSYEILYQMKYNGELISPVTVDVSVSELRPSELALSGGIVWSANKLSEATASDVVASMLFTDEIVKIDAIGEYDKNIVILERSGKELSVSFKYNHPTVSFRCYAENGTYVNVELDAVTNIDRTAPTVTFEKVLASDAKRMTVILRVSERATFKEGGGYVGQLVNGSYEYTRVITDNGEYTYTFADMSGLTSSITVSVSELVLEPLTAQFSKNADGTDAVSDPSRLDLTVGETVFIKPSRDASVQLSDGHVVSANSGAWTAFSIPAALGGVSPYVIVTDAYGNVYVDQFSTVIPLDTAPPEIVINKDVWTVRAGSDREELREALTANATAFDDSGETVTVLVEFPESTEIVGMFDVRYYATDSSGNTAEAYGRLRITSIYDPIVYLGETKIDREEGIYLSEGDITKLLINSAGIEFDLYLVAGRKTAAQMKGENALVRDAIGGEHELGELTSGIYTVLIVTEQRDYFRFFISVSKEEPGN